MPSTYAIDRDRRLVLTRYYGVLSSGDAARWTRRVTADPNFSPDLDHLCSFEDVTDAAIDSAGVREAALLSPFTDASRRAFIVPNDLTFGLGRMFQAYGGDTPQSNRLFRDPMEAAAWLGQDASVLVALSALRASIPSP